MKIKLVCSYCVKQFFAGSVVVLFGLFGNGNKYFAFFPVVKAATNVPTVVLLLTSFLILKIPCLIYF